jgi:hypothetical protein
MSPPLLRHALTAALLTLALAPAAQAMTPLDESALSEARGAGLDEQALAALASGSALAMAPALPLQRDAQQQTEAQLRQQGLQLQLQAGVTSAQIAGVAGVLGASVLLVPVLPLALPMIGLPFLGLLPMLPPPKKS